MLYSLLNLFIRFCSTWSIVLIPYSFKLACLEVLILRCSTAYKKRLEQRVYFALLVYRSSENRHQVVAFAGVAEIFNEGWRLRHWGRPTSEQKRQKRVPLSAYEYNCTHSGDIFFSGYLFDKSLIDVLTCLSSVSSEITCSQ